MFLKEIEFENHIRGLIREKIISVDSTLVLLDNKDVVDIIMCKNAEQPKLLFLEAKFYTKGKNRIGFGDRYGKGFQPEILDKQPSYFKKNMRWVFGRENDSHYYIADNDKIGLFFCGGVIGIKQNNFQVGLFDSIEQLSEEQFVEYLKNWINS